MINIGFRPRFEQIHIAYVLYVTVLINILCACACVCV